MSAPVPIFFQWNGEVMVPSKRQRTQCDRQYVVGEVYLLEQVVRTDAARRHYFATVNDIWKNLPEDETRFPTPSHLRKWALCRTGYAKERSIVCDDAEHAKEIAAFVRPMDEFAVITCKENIVRVYTPLSQSTRGGMDKDQFRASKDAVLNLISGMIGVKRSEAEKHSDSKTGDK